MHFLDNFSENNKHLLIHSMTLVFYSKSHLSMILFKCILYSSQFFEVMNTKIEIFVACITIISVIVILFQQFAQPTGTTLITIYIFDLIVVIILIVDFYFRMKESKQGMKFIVKHCYEIPAMISLTGLF